MNKLDCADFNIRDPISRILKRQLERKKEGEKYGIETTNIEHIEKFIEVFHDKQKEIEKELELSESIEQENLYNHFKNINEKIQELQKLYSNATIFLRIYDKKICQSTLNTLQMRLRDLENHLLPKKKFNFTVRKSKMDSVEVKNDTKQNSPNTKKNNEIQKEEICGFSKRENEILVLQAEEIEKKDVILTDIKNSSIKLYGNPTTLHITNLEKCHVYCGPVTTSVFVENVKDSLLHLACQQLRIHETTNTDFYVHVTSKAMIEDSKGVRFGVYKLNYNGIEDHYKLSGLNRNVNNWDKIDDFNWLALDKPSPNWLKIIDEKQ